MSKRGDEPAPDLMRRVFTVRTGSVIFLMFCLGVTFVSVGITAVLAIVLGRGIQARMGALGQVFESVNAVFSGLGFIALVITFRLQYDELRLQRQELENQREAMNRSQTELRRSAEADMRNCHVELIRLSMVDDDLAEVWPDFQAGLPARLKKQYSYANLIIQHQRMLNDLGFYKDEDARRMFRYLFSSPIIRSFWESRRAARDLIVGESSPEWAFEQIIDLAYDDVVFAPPPFDLGGGPDAPESDAA